MSSAFKVLATVFVRDRQGDVYTRIHGTTRGMLGPRQFVRSRAGRYIAVLRKRKFACRRKKKEEDKGKKEEKKITRQSVLGALSHFASTAREKAFPDLRIFRRAWSVRADALAYCISSRQLRGRAT